MFKYELWNMSYEVCVHKSLDINFFKVLIHTTIYALIIYTPKETIRLHFDKKPIKLATNNLFCLKMPFLLKNIDA